MFPAATLLPVPLIAGAAAWGGGWTVAAVAAMTAFVTVMDRLVRLAPAEPEAEFPAGRSLSTGLGLLHFPLLAGGIWLLASGDLNLAERLGVFLALGLWLGQVSNSNAHELIHRGDRRLVRLGRWVYVSLLFGHHVSAHPKVHHRWVGSRHDPNTARLGESFWRFAPRAWRGSFIAGWRAEDAMLRRRGPYPWWRHPYTGYLGGAALCLAAAAALGPAVLGWYVTLCVHAQMQLLLSDYVQHYGLERREIAPGKLEPVGARHSWNAPQPWSSRMMLHAPRHSDHHAHPAKSFDRLEIPADAPMLPRSLPVMGALALWPRAWRRVMDRRARRWRGEPPAHAPGTGQARASVPA